MRIPPLFSLVTAVLLVLGAPARSAPERLRLPDDFDPAEFQTVAEGTARSGIAALEACHLGGRRLLFRMPWREPGVPADVHLYLDLDDNPATGREDADHRGVDLMLLYRDGLLRATHRNDAFPASETFARVAADDRAVWILLFAPLPDNGAEISFRTYVSGATPPVRVQLPRSPRYAAESVPPSYRYRANRVALESREYKGLVFDRVAPEEPFAPPRPRPPVPFARSGARKPDAAGHAVFERVEVRLREEAGADRAEAPVSFGFPFPRGALFDPAYLRVVDAAGAEVPAQAVVTAFWPDNSLKWVLLDWTDRFAAGEERVFFVAFGSSVPPASVRPPLALVERGGRRFVDTGGAVFAMDADRFARFSAYRPGAAVPAEVPRVTLAGAVIEDDDGRVYSTADAPAVVSVEEQGSEKLVVRIEGPYADGAGAVFMRAITRLTFRAGSGRITIAHTHVNDVLETEFTDVSSLRLPFEVAGGVARATVYEPGCGVAMERRSGQDVRAFQADDATGWLGAGSERFEAGRLPGLLRVEAGDGAVVQAVHHEFWQRWPKALEAGGAGFAVDLLPRQPDAGYGQDLPHYLRYPLVDGFYRFKWGMAFTERVTLDVLGEASPEELRANADVPLVAVIPAAWYARTEALGRMTAAQGAPFDAWDRFFARGYQDQVERRERQREYGFFNYGDWFGERGRNWGNNEYDTAHVFFLQFARTGRTAYHRLALASARHQADVDLVHAYPDPYYVGANHQHSIGHTGEWSQRPAFATWSFAYNIHTEAAGGHTWAEGMAQAWYLAGDARVMEGALALGEHVTWAMAPSFTMSPSAPRGAGWTLRAIMALYRATGDPAYREAAGRIAAEAVRTLDERGLWIRAWPSGESGVSNFQQGLTMAALSEYHAETGDAAVEQALRAGVGFLARAWPGSGGWPYVMTPEGTPESGRPQQIPGMNLLNAESVAYLAARDGDPGLLRVVEQAVDSILFYHEPTARGQQLTYTLRSGNATLALLDAAYRATGLEPEPRMGTGNSPALFGGILSPPVFRVRQPALRVFRLRLTGPGATLRLSRVPTLAAEGRQGHVRLLDTAGRVVRSVPVDLEETATEIEWPVAGDAGSVFRLEIEDERWGVWTLEAPGAQVLARTDPGFMLSNVGTGRYFLRVPAGVDSIRVRLQGIHPGVYGAALLDPEDGQVLGFVRNVNRVGVRVPGLADEDETDGSARDVLAVAFTPAEQPRTMPLVLWGSNALGVEIEGVPPYLALDPGIEFEGE